MHGEVYGGMEYGQQAIHHENTAGDFQRFWWWWSILRRRGVRWPKAKGTQREGDGRRMRR
jgi:hypothetical protein